MKYLLDRNVLQDLKHVNVKAWLATVNDSDLYLSVMAIKEASKGIHKAIAANKTNDPKGSLAKLEALKREYAGRTIEIDGDVAMEWGRLSGEKDKHSDDMAYAATARVHGMVLVTRNVKDFEGRDVDILDPFKKAPKVVRV